jgi:hypothetical protein
MNRKQVEEAMVALGAIAEMAHQFYTAMIGAGASKDEATAGMTAYINSFVASITKQAKKKGDEDDAE